MYFQHEKPAHQDCVLSYLDLASFRKASLKEDLSSILKQTEARGELPLGSLKDVAVYRIKEEITGYHKALDLLHVDKADIFSVELNVSCKKQVEIEKGRWISPPLVVSVEGKEITIVGKIEGLSLQGVLIHGEEKIEDLIKGWPLYLVARSLPFNIQPYFLLTKEGKQVSPPFTEGEKALAQYIKYALMASHHPSPCLPKFTNILLREEAQSLEKAFQTEAQGNFSDPILQWLREQEGLPSIAEWHRLWAPLLKEVFLRPFT
ncbi:MAG: hypothetical protein LVR00_08575 [Rhabdochlamydiaceae bacterium]